MAWVPGGGGLFEGWSRQEWMYTRRGTKGALFHRGKTRNYQRPYGQDNWNCGHMWAFNRKSKKYFWSPPPLPRVAISEVLANIANVTEKLLDAQKVPPIFPYISLKRLVLSKNKNIPKKKLNNNCSSYKSIWVFDLFIIIRSTCLFLSLKITLLSLNPNQSQFIS